ncbi:MULTISPECIES: zinc metalloprotease HtpX [unclassified Methanoregula]|uniref:zinc metalloprotease HtpX n=1 Tax=unclassified Methanoregula TaxID=2649730 RepID=UPI0009C4EB21|nr:MULTISPECIES: zinc metalloprotease HtpX [unclassified Methanoregula]OPX61720.1 MAG: heat shock protein HtpX [Methanoregula sp. PtaB.Bin085]OPY33971.1 MAG: heat shock protein HtpX [Methanoregula sp. PtaU1.Bin006]
MEWKRDWGLTARVWFTGLLLVLLYLVFMTILLVLFPSISTIFLVLLAVGMGLVQYFFSDRMVLWSTGSRIVEEDEYPELHRMVEKLCKEADLPKPKVAIMQSPIPNAFATGRNPNHAVIACTDSIMRLLNRDELEAVLAHELAHVKNRDILTMTLASFIAMISSMIMQSFIFSALFGGNNREGNILGVIVVWVVSIIVYFVSTLLIMALSRYREFAADRGSALITRNPRALISALNKISGRIDVLPDQVKEPVANANTFFIIPASTKSLLRELTSTHPPLEKRIANLEKVEAEIRGY